MLVDDRVIVDLKSVEALKPVSEIQLVTYLRSAHLRVGHLINFNVPILKGWSEKKSKQFLCIIKYVYRM